jgi:hypothetical protein
MANKPQIWVRFAEVVTVEMLEDYVMSVAGEGARVGVEAGLGWSRG